MFNIEPIVCDYNPTRVGFSGEIINERSERIVFINVSFNRVVTCLFNKFLLIA